MKSKIKPKMTGSKNDRANAEPQEHVVVFGTQRIGAIYALRAGINPKRIRLATEGMEAFRGVTGAITVVRVSDEVWQPPTNPCALRTRETEQALKEARQAGVRIKDVFLD